MADAPQLTDRMRRDLDVLEACGWMGATRGRGAWRGTAGNVDLRDAPALTTARLARIDYKGRSPRLKLTAAGRKARLEARGGRE